MSDTSKYLKSRIMFCCQLILFLLLLPPALFSEPQSERLVITHNLSNAPYKFINDSSKSDGILIDIWKLWSKKTMIPLRFAASDFDATVTLVAEGKADINSGLFSSPAREKILDFSDPVMELDYFLFCERSVLRSESSNNAVMPYVIGVPEGFTAEFAKRRYPLESVRIFPDYPSIYKSCERGELKVFISPKENLKYYLETNQKSNIFTLLNKEPVYSEKYRGAVKKGNTELLKKINDGLSQISDQEIENIKRSWFEKVKKTYSFESNGHPVFDAEEIEYISGSGLIAISGDPDWPPHSVYDTAGNYTGIIPDLWEIIERKSGLRLNRIRSDNWANTIEMMKEGKIRLIDCISKTESRTAFMEFSDIIFTSNIVMIGREESDYVNGLSDIGGKSLAVQEGTSEIEFLHRDHPDLKLIYYSDPDIAYRDLSAGKIDLFLRHQADFSYKKKKNILSNLKIAGPTEYQRDYSVGVAKGEDVLLRIINKSLASITQEEKNKIFEKWIGSEKSVIDYDLVWKTGIVSLFIILLIIYWNRRLSNEVELRKKAQTELEIAMEKAETATRAKSRFLANMSHEIRTPMNAILGFSDLLKKTPLSVTQETYLNTIRSGGETLLHIINDILDLSKIEANKMEINYSYFDLHSMIYELKQFFYESVKAKNLDFIVENENELPRSVFLDELRIRQIFFNLLSNAVKFTNRGYIKIVSSFIKKTSGTIDLRIVVEDSGPGIRKEDHEKIFGAFEQAGTTERSKKFQGTGLGLAITQRLVELMNGKIRVESEPDKGSRFIVEFFDVTADVNSSQISGQTEKKKVKERFLRSKVLIADDIESNRLLLSEICRGLGFEVLEAVNGLEAVESAKLNVPDLILMDVRMPEMDGYEAVEVLKKDPSLCRIPVLAVTASVMTSDRDKISQYGFDGYIRKPVEISELVENLKRFIPYETSEDTVEEQADYEDNIKDKEALIEALKTKIKNEVKTAREKHNFSQIRELSQKMKELSIRHNSAVLMNYSGRMFSSVMKYDIDEIKSVLGGFDDIVENIIKQDGGENDNRNP